MRWPLLFCANAMKQFFTILILGSLLVACTDRPEAIKPPTREQQIQQNLDSLKQVAVSGDVVVRAGDDLLSYQIKFLNEADKTYSHAGMIVERDGQKMVAHITPDNPVSDGVQYIPIDSFFSPSKNLSCALYRYTSPSFDCDKVAAVVDSFRQAGVHFDRVYDLATDSLLYCSEMISKALSRATAGNIVIKQATVPKEMQKTVYRYFQKKLSPATIAERRIITVDNLYRHPTCQLVMSFQLKYFPGQ